MADPAPRVPLAEIEVTVAELAAAWSISVLLRAEEQLAKEKRERRRLISVWKEKGLITATPGDVVDYDAVEAKILALCDAHDVKEIAFDPHLAQQMQASLQADGHNVTSFRQGWITMAPAIKTLEEAIGGRRFFHDGNEVLRWCFSNVVVEVDKAENRSFHKGKATGRIDGAVAAAMAGQQNINEFLRYSDELQNGRGFATQSYQAMKDAG